MFWVCRVFNLFGDYLVLVYIIYIYIKFICLSVKDGSLAWIMEQLQL